MTEQELMDDFLATTSYDETVDWRFRPDLGEGDDDEDEGLVTLGGVGSGHYGHAGGAGGEGNPGGSDSSGITVVKKAKAPPATKEQIEKAVAMKANGASYAEVEKATGLNPKQAATIVFKHKKATAAAITQLTGVSKEYQDATKLALTEVDQLINKLPATKPVVPAVGTPEAQWKAELASWVTPHDDQAQLSQLAKDGVTWKEKTHGPAKGKYAFFDKNGVQISHNAPKENWATAAETINFGKGPKYVAPKPPPPPPKPGVIGTSSFMAEYHGTVADPIIWPIDETVTRQMGTTYFHEIEKGGKAWRKSVTQQEADAVQHYTGAGSHINSNLRHGQPLNAAGQLIQSALFKGPKPPPPELVWRGVPGVASPELIKSLNAGDVIRIKGFQSTSVNPEKGNSWSSGQTLFEIKPAQGAYAGAVSGHTSEREYLLPHGMKYTVRGAKMVPIGTSKKLRQVIQLEMVPPE